LTVNVMCCDCDGRRLCDACKAASRALAAAGVRVEHSTRYAAMRAAVSGTYGFEACIVPIADGEKAVLDAALALFADKRLAVVLDDAENAADLPPDVARLPRRRYAAGDFDVSWLRGPLESGGPAETATHVTGGADILLVDRAAATRRLKRVADRSRVTLANAEMAAPPPLDLLAALEDEIAWAQASDGAFALVLVHVPGIGQPNVEQASQVISRAVRSIDVLAARGEDFLVVLQDSDAAGAARAADRIAAALESSTLRAAIKPRRTRGFGAWSVGTAAFPADGATRDVLLARATATLTPVIGRDRP
jgi:GGDEF domain-containing protein